MYLSGVLPWKSSKWEAPPPEEITRIRKEAGTHDTVDPENEISRAPVNGDTNGFHKESGETDLHNEKNDDGPGFNVPVAPTGDATHKETV